MVIIKLELLTGDCMLKLLVCMLPHNMLWRWVLSWVMSCVGHQMNYNTN